MDNVDVRFGAVKIINERHQHSILWKNKSKESKIEIMKNLLITILIFLIGIIIGYSVTNFQGDSRPGLRQSAPIPPGGFDQILTTKKTIKAWTPRGNRDLPLCHAL